MATIKTQPKKPILSSSGSAIGNYFSEKPKDDRQDLKWEAFDIKNEQHKYILSMLHTIGWTKIVNGTTVGNMATFAHWLQTKSPVTKPLTEMSSTETSKVIFAFERVVKFAFK